MWGHDSVSLDNQTSGIEVDLTPHFTLEELTATLHRGIDNSLPPSLLPNVERMANTLERVRALLGQPVIVSSCYRCDALNIAVGGSLTSRHKLALATDFICPKYGSVLKVCQAIEESDIAFDQLIYEYARWVHLGLAKVEGTERRQVLTILDPKIGYRQGLPLQ